MSRRAPSGNVDASRDRLLQEAAHKQNMELRRWLYDMVGYDVGDNLFEALADGVILCSICNTIRPGIVAKINPAPKVAFKKMENINNFLAAAKRLMVPSSCLFDTIDLVQQANTAKVTKCLLALAEVAARNGKGIKRTGEKKAADVELDETETVILEPGAAPPEPKADAGISITDDDLAEYLARDEDEEAALRESEEIRKAEQEKQEGRKRGETLRKEEEARKAKEAAEAAAKEEADKKAKEAAEAAAKEEADKKAKLEAERRAKEEADKKAKEEADRKAKEEADKKAKEESERRARAESDAKKAKEEADRKAKEEADKKAKEEAERRAREEEERKREAEAARQAKAAEEAAAQRAKEEAEKKAKDEEAARKAKEAEERKERLEKIRRDREAIEERKRKVQREKEEFERLKAEGRSVDEIKRIMSATPEEEEARKAKEEAERKAKDEAERKAKDEADRKAKDEADRKAKEEAERKAAEAAAKEEADKTKLEAERRAKEEADRKAKEESERRARAESDAKKAKEEADRKAKEEADKKAKEEADRRAKEESERRARAESDAKKAKEEADRKAKEEADRKAKEEADRKAKEAADKKAKEEADKKAKEEAERKEAERKTREEEARKAKEEADRKAKEAATPSWAANKLKPTGVATATPPASPAAAAATPSPSPVAKKAAARFGSSYVASSPAPAEAAPAAKPKANRFASAYAAPSSPAPAVSPAPATPAAPTATGSSLGKIDSEALLVWCQQGTFSHDVVVKDLHDSWRDGLAFCALVATHKPAALDLNKARSLARPQERLALAFEALAGVGVPSLLDPADFPDQEAKVVTYLSLVQKAFGASADDLAAENDWPPAVRDFKKRFEDFDARFGKLTDQDIVAGQGVAMNNELNAMFPELKRLKDDYWPEELRHIILRFNDLRKLLPQRVNEVYSKTNAQRAASAKAAAPPSSDTCAKCNKPLSGETVEAAGCSWHRACFSCQDCGKKLVNTCLNVGNKPYCEACGKSAFIKAMRKK